MKNLVRVATISPEVHIGDVDANLAEIGKACENIEADIIVTPELSLVGYTTQDLLFNNSILRWFNDKFNMIIGYLQRHMKHGVLIVGAPIAIENTLYNCAIVLTKDEILGIVPKCYLPNYSEFYEKRWFNSGFDNLPSEITIRGRRIPFGHSMIFNADLFKFGVEICEDLWAPNPPSVNMCMNGAEIILNLSASNETIGKSKYRRALVAQQSARCICGYVYCSAGSSESTSDIVFSGHNIIAENGSIICESELFDNNTNGLLVNDIDLEKIRHDRLVNKTFNFGPKASCRELKLNNIVPHLGYEDVLREISITPFVPKNNVAERCMEIFDIQTEALARRWRCTGSKHIVLGVSGGLDSTLALLVAVGAADKLGYTRDKIVGLTMPCFGTTSRTKDNAIALMKELGITSKEVNIGDSVKQHLKDLGLSENDRSIAYENAQARERTQLLMDYANMIGGFVIGTGDLSELALGWCTYNGDHMSMYSVNCSIPKTLVRTMVQNIGIGMANGFKNFENIENKALADCIVDILETPVSPELLPPSTDGTIAQLTEDSVGPYVLNDFFLFYTLRYGFDRERILAYAVEASKQSKEYTYSTQEIDYWLYKFYTRFTKAQFKRNCCPDGIKVGSVSFSPRGDWRMATETCTDTFMK